MNKKDSVRGECVRVYRCVCRHEHIFCRDWCHFSSLSFLCNTPAEEAQAPAMCADAVSMFEREVISVCFLDSQACGPERGLSDISKGEAATWACVCYCRHPITFVGAEARFRGMRVRLSTGVSRDMEAGVFTAVVKSAINTLMGTSLAPHVRYLVRAFSRVCPDHHAIIPSDPVPLIRPYLLGLTVSQQGAIFGILSYGMLGGRGSRVCEIVKALAQLVDDSPLKVKGYVGQHLMTACRPDVQTGRTSAASSAAGGTIAMHTTADEGMKEIGEAELCVAPTQRRKRTAHRRTARKANITVGGVKVQAVTLEYAVRFTRAWPRVPVGTASAYKLVQYTHTASCVVSRSQALYHMLLAIFYREYSGGRACASLYQDVPALKCHAGLFEDAFHARVRSACGPSWPSSQPLSSEPPRPLD